MNWIVGHDGTFKDEEVRVLEAGFAVISIGGLESATFTAIEEKARATQSSVDPRTHFVSVEELALAWYSWTIDRAIEAYSTKRRAERGQSTDEPDLRMEPAAWFSNELTALLLEFAKVLEGDKAYDFVRQTHFVLVKRRFVPGTMTEAQRRYLRAVSGLVDYALKRGLMKPLASRKLFELAVWDHFLTLLQYWLRYGHDDVVAFIDTSTRALIEVAELTSPLERYLGIFDDAGRVPGALLRFRDHLIDRHWKPFLENQVLPFAPRRPSNRH